VLEAAATVVTAEPRRFAELPAGSERADPVWLAEDRAERLELAADELVVELRVAVGKSDANASRALAAALGVAGQRATHAREAALRLRALEARISEVRAQQIADVVKGVVADLSGRHGWPAGVAEEAERMVGREFRRLAQADEPLVGLPDPLVAGELDGSGGES
jgi:hypothetical protein